MLFRSGQGAGQGAGLRLAGRAVIPSSSTGEARGSGVSSSGDPTTSVGAGVGHEDNARGTAIDPLRATQALQIHGQQRGSGPSRSQVIRTAAADGFASAPYRQVYSPYWDQARESLHQGEVPAGFRSYVRRYFQLIRPRDEP